ncbi:MULTISPECIES: SDR family oxidoreductase [Streptomyces]|uniref:SDR family oxidoreductase n=1 Tax=Streptomyces plicatus TaxID=1922 RepID=A0ABW1Y6S4_STRPL|nr:MULTISPECIES: SDR family oxidoreductase [Streptomyces]WDI22276.1 SDR family oxidoreductase [Streptomyces enissocaesilis]KYK15107.1 oxidoreductase [Streptomyces sp. CC71]MBQ0878634.1 SDR family oxidoreductase [Streptomyces sp. RT42]MBQ0912594.1 SDR family oxidoreductase [Streptomyces sp. RM99]MDI3098084.1 SDR family oxidoreductase [Streptomyces sp. AN-3]
MSSPSPSEVRVAVVTGADSGIGRATAVRLAEAGMDVGITWHTDEEGAERTAEEVRARGRRAETARVDLTRLPEAAETVDGLCDRLGRVDVLVNNAGTGTATPFLDLGLDDLRHVLDVDLAGPFLCGQKAARRMIAQGGGGRIVNVTSVHEHQPRVGAAPYCAAKGGLGLLTQVMAIELAEHGITVNAVAPGEIATPMTGQEDTDPHTERRPGVPLGRPGDAREVAAVIAFLAGPDASYVTGASWSVDGGMLRMGPMAGSHLTGDDWRRP